MIIDVDVQRVTVGDVDLAYTAAGDPADPPVLLVAGLGAQLISWEDGFCQALVDRGLYVIRFDNRDAGLSTHLGKGEPDLAYALTDLAGDAAGLIDALGLRLGTRGRCLDGRDDRSAARDRASAAGSGA